MFHDASRVGHRDPVADRGGHGQVVGHQQHGGSTLAQAAQQSEHVGLHGDVQSGGGLVGDNQSRGARDGHRDRHPLTQAPGELVRVLSCALLGVGHPGVGQQRGHRSAVGAPGCLGDLAAHAHRRIQRGHRADVDAAPRAPLRLGGRGHVQASQAHLTLDAQALERG